MNYRISCRNSYPYRNWYADINNLKLHIEERCKEIVEKYHEQTVNYDTKLKEAYKDGEECGMIYEQHNDPTLEIRLKQNNELISLESEMKSTLEKILKNIITYFNLSSQKRKDNSYLSSYMLEIEENKEIDMSEFAQERKDIFLLNTNRNKSEHESDNLLREIDQSYIRHQLNSAYLYMNTLIQRLFDNR
ncbi:hypothetical protein [Parabacteroides distasonis]|jgi:hypothetical protein|uniref:Uncharacterized protein n=1 Tax=Parabacteroides distasonis TaxID=823 RepID=A0A174T6H8_PARDI|nr:hypothetical protein [Parabacteroides distasonis]MRY86782.1 hypothetical protein [Parabacteroides distasonis]MRZ05981.1 hypothetical protein [Parabacteroides distasonis]CUQ04131.1 Uncharacterised protein [Parabacteroides distasonis]